MGENYSLEDLSGTKIDYITFIKKEKCGVSGHARYLCRCDCGNEFTKRKDVIMKMRIKSCGCKSIRKTPIRPPVKPKEKCSNEAKLKDHTDLSGNIFGRLVVLECIGSDKHHKRLYRCLCDCGKEKITTQALLKRGEVTSCGCKQKEIIFKQNGLSTKRIYTVYQSMKIRCYNKNFKQYKDYGGRGIKICPEWLGENGAKNFCEWAYSNGYDENAPRGQCTLDRIDVNGDYCPENCRWVSMSVQANNKTDNVYLKYQGITDTLSNHARRIGISPVLAEGRYLKGMELSDVFRVGRVGEVKKVAQYDKDMNLIKIWSSCMEVCDTLGFNMSNLRGCLSGYRKTTHGYIWKYYEEG